MRELGEAHGGNGARLRERTSLRRGREGLSVSGSGGACHGGFVAHPNLTSRPGSGVQPPGSGYGLRTVGHRGRFQFG